MTDLDIVDVFARCFWTSHATQLLGGADEPLYQPAGRAGEPHRLFYRENFAASALHETCLLYTSDAADEVSPVSFSVVGGA